MTLSVKRVLVLASVLAAFATFYHPAASQDGFDPSHKLSVRYIGSNLSVLLSGFAQSYAVTIGFETDSRQARSSFDIDAPDANLTGLLNAVVRAAPQYRWRESGKAIDVLPATGGVAFMEARVAVFQVKEVGQRQAIDQLLKLPETQAAMKAEGLRFIHYKETLVEEHARPLSLSLEGLTVREALHEIVKRSGTKFWEMRRGEGGAIWIGTPERQPRA